MPHLRLEFSNNLTPHFDVSGTLKRLNQTLVETGHFKAIDIKSRALPCQDFVIGTASGGHAFAHVQLIILKGRDAALKTEISKALLTTLVACIAPAEGIQNQLCVEIIDNDRDCYMKQVV